MNPQVPRGPDNMYCPQWRKKMSAVCHTCPLWLSVDTKGPNDLESVKVWQCAIAVSAQAAVEQINRTGRVQAAVESMRNEVVTSQAALASAAAHVGRINEAAAIRDAAIVAASNVLSIEHKAAHRDNS